MVITYKENEIPKITFSELQFGEVFSRANELFMKLDFSNRDNNAWCFNTDGFATFDMLDEVVPVDAELVIKERWWNYES